MYRMSNKNTIIVLKILSAISILFGASGMIFSIPFMLFYSVLEAIAAGLAFICGGILFSAGLISLSILNTKQ